jgi:hypothetical protein
MGRGRINYRENFVVLHHDESGAPGKWMNGPEMNERGRGAGKQKGFGRNVHWDWV